MNKQALIFVGLVIIAGFFISQSRKPAEVNPLKNTDTLSNNEMEGKDAESMTEQENSEELATVEDETPGVDEPTGDVNAVRLQSDQSYISYTNKAVGYTIDRPDGWYWQHFTAGDLVAVEGTSNVLALNRTPLPPVEEIFDALITIDVTTEVSVTDPEQKIAGRDAERIEHGDGTLEYRIELNNSSTLRLVHNSVDATERTIFEHIVKSLSF